jgi:hypothetical protein
MECPACHITMVMVWNEPLGLVAACPCCLKEIEVHYDRRRTDRGVKGDKAA